MLICVAVAIMEVLEDKLLLMSSEELLKDFRSLAAKVDSEKVLIKALTMSLVPVRLEVGNVWVESPDECIGGFLFVLRNKYLNEARTAHKERCTDKKVQPSISSSNPDGAPTYSGEANAASGATPIATPLGLRGRKRSESSAGATTPVIPRVGHWRDGEEDDVPLRAIIETRAESEEKEPREDRLDDMGDESRDARKASGVSEADSACRGQLLTQHSSGDGVLADQLQPSDSTDSIYFKIESSYQKDPLTSQPRNVAMTTPTGQQKLEQTAPFISVSATVGELELAPDLHSRITELRSTMYVCNRVHHWARINKLWLDCLSLLPSNLSKYNLADQMLRHGINTGAHIRAIAFFLAVGGADPNSQDVLLRTPLHIAVQHNRPDVVRLLIMCGADTSVVGALGSSSKNLQAPEDLPCTVGGKTNMTMTAAHSILRGKTCLHCNKQLPPAPDERRARCPQCLCTLCVTCTQHWCVPQLVHIERRDMQLAELRRKQAKSLKQLAAKSKSSSSDTNSIDINGGGNLESNPMRESRSRSRSEGPQMINLPSKSLSFKDIKQVITNTGSGFTNTNNNIGYKNKSTDRTDICIRNNAEDSDVHPNAISMDDCGGDEKSDLKGRVRSGSAAAARMVFGKHHQQHSGETLLSTSPQSSAKSKPNLPMKLGFLKSFPKVTSYRGGKESPDHSTELVASTNAGITTSSSQKSHGDASQPHSSSFVPLPFFPQWLRHGSSHGDASNRDKFGGTTSPQSANDENERNNQSETVQKVYEDGTVAMDVDSVDDESAPYDSTMTSQKSMPHDSDSPVIESTSTGQPSSTKIIDVRHNSTSPSQEADIDKSESNNLIIAPWKLLWKGGTVGDTGTDEVDSSSKEHRKGSIIFGPSSLGVAEHLTFDAGALRLPVAQIGQHLKRGFEVAANALRFDGQVPEDDMINSDGVPVYWIGYGDKRKTPQYWQLFLLPLVFGAEDIFGNPSRVASNFSVNIRNDMNATARFLYFKSEMQSIYSLLERDAQLFMVPQAAASSPLSSPDVNNISSEYEHNTRTADNNNHAIHGSVLTTTSGQNVTSPTITQASSSSEMSLGTEATWTDAGEDSPEHDATWRESVVSRLLSGEWVLNDNHVLWVSDEDAWCCARCWAIFGLFNRKHHCRRCGGMFCNEHAPLRDLQSCVPESFKKVRTVPRVPL